jgi:hypothetical protein
VKFRFIQLKKELRWSRKAALLLVAHRDPGKNMHARTKTMIYFHDLTLATYIWFNTN